MQFVFGRRASDIRLKKVSELVHNSNKFPNVQSCRVSVHFQEIIDNVIQLLILLLLFTKNNSI